MKLRSLISFINYLAKNAPNAVRSDRFYTKIAGVTDNKFHKSRFLKYYNQTQRCPSTNQIIDSLIGLGITNDRNHRILQLIQSQSEDYNVLHAYTSNEMFGSIEFYQYVNKQLRNDDSFTLRQLMPFIRRATQQINDNGPLYRCVVYRGMNLENRERNYFTPGKVFRFPGFTSTSSNIDIARGFGNTLFQIQIPAGCRQVRDVAAISCFTYEQEWLFSPYSRFQVQEKQSRMIVLVALDNIEGV